MGRRLASPSLKDLERIARGAVNFTGLLSLDIPSLLDTSPLGGTLQRAIPFPAIAEHVANQQLITAAVVTLSARTGRSIVFHTGGTPDQVRDDKRGIDYVPAELTETHVRASSAIPALFPAVRLDDGWHFDGGTRLNAPIKPALAFGAKRVIVIGLHSIAPGTPLAGDERPDLAAGAALVLDALLADPLVEDLQTLTTINRLAGPERQIPYIFVAPPERDTIGQIARDVFRRHYGGLLHARAVTATGVPRALDRRRRRSVARRAAQLPVLRARVREGVDRAGPRRRARLARRAARRRAMGPWSAWPQSLRVASAASMITNGSIAIR